MRGNDPLQQDSVDLVCNSTWTWAGCNEHGVEFDILPEPSDHRMPCPYDLMRLPMSGGYWFD